MTDLEQIVKSEKGLEVPLSDLLMVQMAGDFDRFLALFTSETDPEKIAAVIEETREEITGYKLYPSFIRKTIESQVGEKHTAIRELAQNSIDAYDIKDPERKVVFQLEEQDQHYVLHVRDYGCGMDLKTLVRDLLIPMNSGKEFDPTKIGEHGIGWFSIVDFADLVKVVTRRPESMTASQAYVYKKQEDWMATIVPQSNNGFFPPLNTSPNGTEVAAFISKSKTTPQQILDSAYQYLGMVDLISAEINFVSDQGTVRINDLPDSYAQTAPIQVDVENVKKPMKLGVSKRAISGVFHDQRFRYRNQNLAKILYTQRGLFIMYDNANFNESSIHATLLNSLTQMGLDFWVDVPDHVKLTKGRNNIIADHHPLVLEGAYSGFEQLFLDVILADEEIVYHSSGSLLQSLSNIFNQRYDNKVYARKQKDFSLKRRLGQYTAQGTSAFLDAASFAVKLPVKAMYYTGVGLYKAAKYPFTDLPGDLEEAIERWKADAPNRAERRRVGREAFKQDLAELGKNLGNAVKRISPYAVGAAALGGGIYEIAKHWDQIKLWNWKLAGYTGLGVLGIASAGIAVYGVTKLVRAMPDCIDALVDYFTHIKDTAPKEKKEKEEKPNREKERASLADLVSAVYHALPDIGRGIVNIPGRMGHGMYHLGSNLLRKTGLYVDMEEKREKKRMKERDRIAKKYLSSMKKDAFFQKIMEKKIINAAYYYTSMVVEAPQESIGQAHERTSLLDRFEMALWGGKNTYNPNPDKKEKILRFRKEKLSIDDIVEFYLQGRIRTKEPMSHGEYLLDPNNPLVSAVITRLEEIRFKVHQKYDVKILEDHINNIRDKAMGLGVVLYFITPIGWVHMICGGIGEYQEERKYKQEHGANGEWTKSRHSAFSKGSYYAYRMVDSICRTFSPENISYWADTKGRKIAKYTGYIIAGPAIGLYYTGKWTGEHVIIPTARAFNPQRLPDTITDFKDWYAGYQLRQEEKKEQRRLNREKRAMEREARKLSSAQEEKHEKEIRERNRIARQLEKERQARVRADLRAEREQNLKHRRDLFFAQVRDWYHNSIVYSFLGDGIRFGNSFTDKPISHIESLMDVVNVGGTIKLYIDAVQKLDQLVSDVLGQKPHKFTLSFNDVSVVGQPLHLGMTSRKKGETAIHLNNLDHTINSLDKAYIAHDAEGIDRTVYTLFDRMIHIYAHELIEKQIGEEYCQAEKTEGFYQKKQELRWKVAEYLSDSGIDLSDFLGFATHERRTYDFFDFRYINQLAHMTRRRLYEEKQRIKEYKEREGPYNYEQEMRKKYEEEKNRLDPKRKDFKVTLMHFEEAYPLISHPPPPPQQDFKPGNWNN